MAFAAYFSGDKVKAVTLRSMKYSRYGIGLWLTGGAQGMRWAAKFVGGRAFVTHVGFCDGKREVSGADSKFYTQESVKLALTVGCEGAIFVWCSKLVWTECSVGSVL